jgi:outer membrane lipoprotein carrier protein
MRHILDWKKRREQRIRLAISVAVHNPRRLTAHCPLLTIHCFLLLLTIPAYPQSLAEAVTGLQNRYKSVETVSGNFQQTYRAQGMDEVKSGVFWLKRPAFMRWEYRSPEEELFVADGRESFDYVPQDRQVTIQPLSAADLHNTPLEFLLGAGNIDKSFTVSWETEFKSKVERTLVIRLTPRASNASYRFLVLELDQATFDIRRIAMRERMGATMEFLLSNVAVNMKIDKKQFQFKTPKGVEEIRLDE